MRLIDVDVLEWFQVKLSNGETCILIRKPHITHIPTIDAVPVVRCKDCKWHGRPGCAIEIVDDSDRPGPEGFCCYAERKQDGGADDV